MNQKYSKRKGISPVLATIILLAVTVAVGVGVASYVFGLFGTYSESAAVKIQGSPTLQSTIRYFNVTLANSGSQTDSVTSISTTVVGTQHTNSSIAGTLTVPGGGGTRTIKAALPNAAFSAGTSYQIKISFTSGALLSVTVTAS